MVANENHRIYMLNEYEAARKGAGLSMSIASEVGAARRV